MAMSLMGSRMKMSPAMSSLMARLETLVQRKTFGTVDPGRQFLFSQPLHFERGLRILLVLFSSHLSNSFALYPNASIPFDFFIGIPI